MTLYYVLAVVFGLVFGVAVAFHGLRNPEFPRSVRGVYVIAVFGVLFFVGVLGSAIYGAEREHKDGGKAKAAAAAPANPAP